MYYKLLLSGKHYFLREYWGETRRRTTTWYKRKLFDQCPECYYCGDTLHSLAQATLDHVLPKSKGGRTVAGNLVLACQECNCHKSNHCLILRHNVVAVPLLDGSWRVIEINNRKAT